MSQSYSFEATAVWGSNSLPMIEGSVRAADILEAVDMARFQAFGHFTDIVPDTDSAMCRVRVYTRYPVAQESFGEIEICSVGSEE